MLHLLEGPLEGHITENRRRRKAQHSAGIKPTNSLLRGMCTTTVRQLLLIYKKILMRRAQMKNEKVQPGKSFIVIVLE